MSISSPVKGYISAEETRRFEGLSCKVVLYLQCLHIIGRMPLNSSHPRERVKLCWLYLLAISATVELEG